MTAEEVDVVVAGIWGELLQRDRISADTHFFEAGGTSLAALQVVARVRQHFKIRLSPVALLEAPQFRAFTTRVLEIITEGEPMSARPGSA